VAGSRRSNAVARFVCYTDCIDTFFQREKRMLIRSREVLVLSTKVWDQHTHQVLLKMRRLHWSGWHLLLFEDCGFPHTAATVGNVPKC